MGTHDEDRHEHGQVWRRSDAPNTSVVSEEIRFKVEVEWPFLDKMGLGEVENHKHERTDAGYLKKIKRAFQKGNAKGNIS